VTDQLAEKIAGILAGQRPSTLTAEEEVAYDLAASLCNPGPVPGLYVAGMYKMVGTIMNAYNEPVPSR